MSKLNFTLSAEQLKEHLHYNPETGMFTRLKTNGQWKAGTQAGFFVADRLRINLVRQSYKGHRLAWLYMTGDWPLGEIDHKDGDSRNNKFDNLRDVSHAVNQQNMRRPRSDNTSGFLGVYFDKRRRKWVACTTLAGKHIHIGTFPTPEQAHEAFLLKKRQIHEGCTI